MRFVRPRGRLVRLLLLAAAEVAARLDRALLGVRGLLGSLDDLCTAVLDLAGVAVVLHDASSFPLSSRRAAARSIKRASAY